MSWIFLEGLDRSGKSTLAKMYEKQGYVLVHMSAPDKKYTSPGYAGPSYMDEMLDVYMKHNMVDTVFDRSPYGEVVWPLVYGRKAQLTEEDFEILREIEDNNESKRYLMYDSNIQAHWKRCVDNKEPLNKNQFNQATVLFDRMGTKFGFTKMELPSALSSNTDYVAPVMTEEEKKRFEDNLKKSVAQSNSESFSTGKLIVETNPGVTVTSPNMSVEQTVLKASKTPEQMKLEKANAINDILSKRIIKHRGPMFDDIENEIRNFLNGKLGTIFGSGSASSLSKEEIDILKVYCQQIKRKMENK